MQYRSAIPDDIETIRDLLIEVGWEKHVREYQDFKKMVENSDRTVVALDGSRIVGFARALCDEVANGYITMVAVAEDKRQDGVGASIVNALMGDNLNIKWVITSDKNSIGFWEKQGFRLFKRAMMRPRLEPDGSYPKNTPPLTNQETSKGFTRKIVRKIQSLISSGSLTD